MSVPLESHYGTWQDPVVRFEIVADLFYLVVIVLLLSMLVVRWRYASSANDVSGIAHSVTAVTGVALTVAFLIPLLSIPSGALFRLSVPALSHPIVILLLGVVPGVLGAYVLGRARDELTEGESR